MSIGICPCGGTLREHQVKKGTAYTCRACGRYEVVSNTPFIDTLDALDLILEDTNKP